MPVEVTENWSDRSYTRGQSGRRGFVVTGVATAAAAVAAVTASTYAVTVNAPFPDDNRLRANTEPEVRYERGTSAFHVLWSYVRPEQGSLTDLPDDPLDQPTRFEWGRGSESGPTDVDAQDNPFVNATYDPFEGGRSNESRFLILTATSNQSSFDLAEAQNYEGRYNGAPVTLPGAVGGGVLAKGQLVCVSIQPVGEYDENSEYVTVVRVFWMRKGNRVDDDGVWDAWKHRVLNVGRSGFYNDGGAKRGRFVGANGQDLPDPVRLNTLGKPMDATIKVEKAAGVYVAPVAAPTSPASVLFEVTANATFLKYYRFGVTDLAPLMATLT